MPLPICTCRQIEEQASTADVAGRTHPWPERDLAILEVQSPISLKISLSYISLSSFTTSPESRISFNREI